MSDKIKEHLQTLYDKVNELEDRITKLERTEEPVDPRFKRNGQFWAWDKEQEDYLKTYAKDATSFTDFYYKYQEHTKANNWPTRTKNSLKKRLEKLELSILDSAK